MKEIKAYVHSNRIADVIASLKASNAWDDVSSGGGHNLTVYVVKGSLLPLREEERHYSLDLGDEVINEYKLELICSDAHVDELVKVIQASARTGQPNSGWIYVADIAQVLPVF